MPFYPQEIKYSDKYFALDYEYTSVILPKKYLSQVTGRKTLNHEQMKSLGIEISQEWENYLVHEPEPHVVLLRRKLSDKEKKKLGY